MVTAKIKEVFVAILLAAILLPIAFTMFYNTSTAGWSATTVLVWAVLPVIAIVVILLRFFDKI
jgi:hypothetical protein